MARHLIVFIILHIIYPSAFAQDSILVLRAEGLAFDEVYDGMVDDFDGEVNFQSRIINKSIGFEQIDKYIKDSTPKLIVVMGNYSITLYTKYQKSNQNIKFPPSISLAALYIDRLLINVKNATGIRYEIPAVTSIVNLRSLSKSPIKKVGVIYRKFMTNFIQSNRKYCEREDIELIGVALPNRSEKYKIHVKEAINILLSKEIDSLWIVNDNALLTPDILIYSWIPTLKDIHIPVIVGVKSLVSTNLKLGTFCVFPDHYSLGGQTANIISEVMNDNWKLGVREIEMPISIKKHLNLGLSIEKGIGIDHNNLGEVDEVLK